MVYCFPTQPHPRRRKHGKESGTRPAKKRPGPKRARNAYGPADTQQGRKTGRSSGFGRMRPAATYLTNPLCGGITVTDSRGLSPHSVCRKNGYDWHDMDFVDKIAQFAGSVKRFF